MRAMYKRTSALNAVENLAELDLRQIPCILGFLPSPPSPPGFFGFSSPESDSTFVNSQLGARGFGEKGVQEVLGLISYFSF